MTEVTEVTVRGSRSLLAAVLAAAVSIGAASGAEITEEDLEHFETRIRPVLVERCYQCHGADSEKIRGGLVLLDAAGWQAGGDSGAVIVPGEPDESLLIEAIRYQGLTQMPPDGRLPPAVVADFEQWVRRGAPDPRTADAPALAARSTGGSAFDYGPGREHWAFRPVLDGPPPGVENESWVSRPIDRFILARLERMGIEPVAEADRRTLLRRVSFDLIGLPPTPEEIETFVADERHDAYERVVERLLASPHYGERWGRHWLDVARYADSNGLDENIAFPNAFRYRDYVIRAFNEDKPFDKFVVEQIAGDLMPGGASREETYERLTATGFLMLGAKVLAEQDVDKMLIDIVDEQINVIGRAFLAEPIGCARCHDHKFDPVPTTDYYALAGILRSTRTMADAERMRWVERPLAAEAVIAEYEAAQAAVAAARNQVDDLVRERNAVLRQPRRDAIATYLLAMEEAYPSWNDDEALQEAARPRIAEIAVREGLEAAVLERWVGAFHGFRTGPPVEGDGPNPKVVFEIWEAYASSSSDDYAQVTERLRSIIASEKILTAPLTRSLVRGPAPRSLEDVAWRYATLFSTIEIAWQEHLGRLGLKRADELTAADYQLPREQEELRRLIFGSSLCIPCLDQEEEEELYPAEARARLAELRAIVADLEAASPPPPPYAMAVEEGEIVDLPVHIRGNHLNLADTPEPRGFLKVTDPVVPPPPVSRESSGRLELARWITHPSHPLTSRVIVNRVWHWHFGRGIVDTPSNFGTTGSKPSHPALLDHLASRFVESGWSIKDLHREILLSSTYRLSTDYDAESAATDEGNRLLWRMNRRRLEAEPIRDSLLRLAGRLDLTIGGRVEEYDPHGYVFSEGNTFGDYDFYAARRRSVYMPVVRNAIYDFFAGFDFGDASDSVGRRPATVVPPQALLMMNSPFVEEQAAAFASRLLEMGIQHDAKRVERAFLEAYGRSAAAEELEDAVAFLAAMRAQAPPPADARTSAEHFAWSRLCHVLLASSEFIYVD